jgi:hypothetical protein
MNEPDQDTAGMHTLPGGQEECPSCGGDNWKSAEMVIMEGTQTTIGSGKGKVTDPGMFSGGFREFLLSDRWFTWDFPLGLDARMQTTSALAEQIKKLMVEQTNGIVMPEEPIAPLEPNLDKPERPVEPIAPKIEPWYRYVGGSLICGLLFGLFSIDHGILIASGVFVVATVFVYCLYHFSNRKRLTWYQSSLIEYEYELFEYESELAEYENELELRTEKYNKEFRYWEQAYRHWKQLSGEIPAQRQRLWDRARVCMRCGTAYFGES